MAWTSPLTAVTNATLTAAQYNAHVRDNMLMTAPAKATATRTSQSAMSTFVTTAANTIAERAWANDIVQVYKTTTSTSYTNLTYTFGPSVSITTGTRALVWFGAALYNTTTDADAYISVDVSGASTVAANDDWAAKMDGITGNNEQRLSSFHLFTGLTSGVNTFTMKYRVSSGTGNYDHRNLAVWAL